MNVKLLRQIGQRLLTPYGSQGHLRFESRRGVPAWSSAHRFSCSAAILAAVRQRLHLSNLFKNPEPALTAGSGLAWLSELAMCPLRLSRTAVVGGSSSPANCRGPSACTDLQSSIA